MKKITIKKVLVGAAITIFGLGILKFNKEKTEIVIESNDFRDSLLIDSFPSDTVNIDSLLTDTIKLDTL